ncbi:hypothetical protein [Jeotgalibacillus sp. R-1-5s-1]|uniref:hypothetical protein n=1 Tax=Jeotgalibacillus sp. R-1-5s-1 TaxID=2555897 RepID=UPI00106A3A04|nr:hypothetical protein [Jeotgalibacillus sp. R-1-5s-1]TFD97051.1 hypothetical protein E2491_10175 [Jeotgalibacillus sp. R-1-5s-1]
MDSTQQGKQFVRDIIKKAHVKLSDFLNYTDFHLTRAQQLLVASKNELQKYLEDRNKLINEIDQKEYEIDQLRNKMNQLTGSNMDELFSLQKQINDKMKLLSQSEKKLRQTEKKLSQFEYQSRQIEKEKVRAIEERNQIKHEFDELNKNLTSLKKDILLKEEEIKELQDHQANSQDIQKAEKLLTDLLEEKHIAESVLETVQSNLKDKMLEVSSLTTKLNELNEKIKLKEQEVIVQLEEIRQLEDKIENQDKERHFLEKQYDESILELSLYKEDYERMSIELNNMKERSVLNDEELKNAINEKNLEIENLNAILENTQDKLNAAESIRLDLTDQEKEIIKVLQIEYEPRFRSLYSQSDFQHEFLNDFYVLNPSDRLKVEACIVNLNYNFQQNSHKVRPNPVKAGNKNIWEYPFADTGRIYFLRENDRVLFYRISRTKNGKGRLDQKRVISWLKEKAN